MSNDLNDAMVKAMSEQSVVFTDASVGHVASLMPHQVYGLAVNQMNNIGLASSYSQKLAEQLDYERQAHAKTLQALIAKDVALMAACDAIDGLGKLVHRAEAVTELCMPTVRDLFGFTSDRKIYDACKAAIAAYEEYSSANSATPDSEPGEIDPVDVGQPGIRHVGDCQGEQPAGMAGLQLPGKATWAFNFDWAEYSRMERGGRDE